MGRVINLVIYCQNGRGRYRAYFEEQQPKQWYGIRAEQMPDLSIFERSLKNQNSKNFGDSLAVKYPAAGNTSAEESYSGAFYSGCLKCPTCGNTGFVKCGRCGELTCWNEGHFVCAACGNSGEVTGTISDVNANSGGGATGPKLNIRDGK